MIKNMSAESFSILPRTFALSKITSRKESMFTDDMNSNRLVLSSIILNAKILVIGAAGSVGTAFVKQLAAFSPGVLHLVDISENNLVELVRDLRCSAVALPDNFLALPIALGSMEMDRFLEIHRYDYILNFSALKHVRSEKDPFSLLRMYNTNVGNVHSLLSKLSEQKYITKFFSVSSDKAVNPHNVMGATKIFMERVHLLHSDRVSFSTARFANVAFSDGSLLHGFCLRVQKKQPISAPIDIMRFFISHEEAGQLCLLSCFLGDNRDIYFPKLDPSVNLVSFSDIAIQFLESLGFKPVIYNTEDEAKNASFNFDLSSGMWPCYFFNSSTTGEKPFEEFFTEDDEVELNRYNSVGVLKQPAMIDNSLIACAVDKMENYKKKISWNKEEIVNIIKIAVPELFHVEKGRNLDQGM